jgi:hypothetical protein
MTGTRRRPLGDLDAAKDPFFKAHFVESLDLLRILNNNSDIVYGSKGVGKTALRRALAELKANAFYYAKTVDLDRINFPQVYAALIKATLTSDSDASALARTAWLNALSIYCLESVAEALADRRGHEDLRNRILNFLTERGFTQVETPNNRLVKIIGTLLTFVANIGLEDCDPPTSPTPPHAIGGPILPFTDDFSLDPSLRQLIEEASAMISKSGKVVLICLDGFDSIVAESAESRKHIFAGLIDAIWKCSKDPSFDVAFAFKAFLPQELTGEARKLVWDDDKFIYNTHFLRWTEKDLQDLVAKRLRPYARTKSNGFMDIWRDFMPEKVTNPTHKIDEPSFGYILRHTLYRPRHLIVHIQLILNRWDESYAAVRVDPSFIPSVVAETNQELAMRVVAQLEVPHPNLDAFLRSWGRSSSTILFGDFTDRIGKYFDCPTPSQANEVFDSIFNFGVCGVARNGDLKNNQKTNSFQFGYVGARPGRKVASTLNRSDVVALSPMLSEYCGCTASEYGVVMPVE